MHNVHLVLCFIVIKLVKEIFPVSFKDHSRKLLRIV